jgi:hypothetical protein
MLIWSSAQKNWEWSKYLLRCQVHKQIFCCSSCLSHGRIAPDTLLVPHLLDGQRRENARSQKFQMAPVLVFRMLQLSGLQCPLLDMEVTFFLGTTHTALGLPQCWSEVMLQKEREDRSITCTIATSGACWEVVLRNRWAMQRMPCQLS